MASSPVAKLGDPKIVGTISVFDGFVMVLGIVGSVICNNPKLKKINIQLCDFVHEDMRAWLRCQFLNELNDRCITT